MRPIDSAYDRGCAASTVTPSTISDPMVYMICSDDRVLIWSTEEDSIDDDGSAALRMGGWPEDIAEIRAILRASSADEI